LDALYIIHLYLILLQIFSKCHTIFFSFMFIFSFSPYLSSAPAKTDQKTEKTSRLADLGLNNFRN
jgi:hypothetical protein